tara:strand:- start:495 stop:1007 length:513 start_codon:yes stop_codon:yes gene_type:complete
MLRARFFYNFFKYEQNKSNEIVKYNSKSKLDLEDQINSRIIEIDEDISKNSTALFEAQIVKLRSTFSKSNNFIDKIGKNVYKKKLEESIDWHQDKLKELYFRRRELQTKLERVQGVFWLNRIKRFLKIIFIGFFILLSLFIFVSGFMIIIYILPLIILILLVYLLINKQY